MAFVVGIGEAAPGDLSDDQVAPVALSLAVHASLRALEDAGVARDLIDGVITYGLFGDVVPAEAIGTALGRQELSLALDLNLGGQAPAMAIGMAAEMIDSGRARAVLVARSLLGRSGLRVGSAKFPRLGEDERRAAGVSAYAITAALWAQRYVNAAGLEDTSLAQAPLHAAATRWSPEQLQVLGCADFGPRPIVEDLAEYEASPLIADPLRRADCVSEVDGAAVVLVVSEELAMQCSSLPSQVSFSSWRSWQADVDMGSVLGVEELSRNVAWRLAEDLRRRADLEASACDVVSLYDCFSSVYLQNIEGIGLCDFGGAPGYLAGRRSGTSNGLWLNPGGGMLARGYVHGMNNAVDAVRATRIVAKDQSTIRTLIVSGGMTSGSATVLTTQH